MITLHVKVKPGSSRDEISVDDTGHLQIKIREQPIDGAANSYLIKFLSQELKLSKSLIHLEKGTTSRFKKIRLDTDVYSIEQIINLYKK